MAGGESTWAVMLPVRPGLGTGYAAAVPPLDFRSDTVTRPTPEMRRAMAEAEVGDDVWGDDPTVIELEAEVAAMLGKEAAVYVPSGTMGNQISVALLDPARRRDLRARAAHVVVHEQGGVAALAGVQTRMLPGAGGVLEPETARPVPARPGRPAPRPPEPGLRREHVGELGGRVYPPSAPGELAGVGARARLARCTWTAPASGTPPSPAGRTPAEVAAAGRLGVSVCFSKGLGAPVGSAVVGSAEFVEHGPA